MPSGKEKRHKMSTHNVKRLRKNRHKRNKFFYVRVIKTNLRGITLNFKFVFFV